MKAAFFLGTREPWYVGLGNRLVRLRLGSQISHCELVFEPGDGVDDLMPDGTCAPVPIGNGGLYWAGSSAAAEPIPPWSPRRAGSKGGIRFKRLDVDACIGAQPQWLLVDVPWANARAAAIWFKDHQGALYDWQGIFGFVAWPIPGRAQRWACHEAVAAALGHPAPARTDPAALCETLLWMHT